MPTLVNQLEFGTEFRSGDVRFRLIHYNDCRAYVQIMNNKRAAITKKSKDGKEEILAEFDAPGQKVNIAPGTLVDEVLRTPAEIEWDSSVTTSTDAEGKTVTVVKASKVKGQRGKPAAAELKRPVNPKKKIGQMVTFLMEGPKPIKEIMSKFSITHGCSLSYLFVLNRDYGFGYTVEKEHASLSMPTNCTDPFKGAKLNEPSDAPADVKVPSPAAPPAGPKAAAKSVPAPAKAVRRKSAGSGRSGTRGAGARKHGRKR